MQVHFNPDLVQRDSIGAYSQRSCDERLIDIALAGHCLWVVHEVNGF